MVLHVISFSAANSAFEVVEGGCTVQSAFMRPLQLVIHAVCLMQHVGSLILAYQLQYSHSAIV
eukprot:7784810-Karenia_brevis.AAC.1